MTEAERDERHAQIMGKRKTAFDKNQASATVEKGLIIVNTGAGKGKSTAALGIIFRALGHGFRVGVVQFTKGAIETGEAAFAKELGERVDFFTLGEGYTWETQNRQRDIATARVGWEKAKELIENTDYNIIVLDELNIILKYDYVPLEEVLETLKNKREDLHVVITGRAAKDELIELADLVTEMKLIKHPYRTQGIKAQKGIEF
ncbi:MAG: cob(I)yrinic acid a,c-diamide adenosyltransferase [Pyrinomonadaceae bacterium]|nr:cob(I)yrinic acid a,c-diamide adenosyltransferase [Pyrinomonadaceae bacterium]